jgi:hypothetical protein
VNRLLLRRLSSDELKKSRPRHTKADYRAVVTRIIGTGQRKGYMLGCDYDVCEAAESEGNAEKVELGESKKNYHSVEKSSCSYIV